MSQDRNRSIREGVLRVNPLVRREEIPFRRHIDCREEEPMEDHAKGILRPGFAVPAMLGVLVLVIELAKLGA